MFQRIVSFVFMAGIVCQSAFLNAQTPATGDGAAAPNIVVTPAAPKLSLEEIFTVQEGKTPEELIQNLQSAQQQAMQTLTPQTTEEEFKNLQLKFAGFIVKTSEAIIAKKPEDKLLEQGYQLKLMGISMLLSENPEKEKEFNTTVEEIKKLGKFPELVSMAEVVMIAKKIELLDPEKEDVAALNKIKDEAIAFLKTHSTPEFSELALSIAEKTAAFAVVKKDVKVLEKISKELADLYLASKEPEAKMIAELIQGAARRGYGQSLNLEGMTVENKKFDWASYRGKVVLIDFWASWCQPCMREYPNILKAYETYKDKGFDVVGIGVMDENAALLKAVKDKKMPWTVLSEELTVVAKMPSLETRFGIDRVPTMFLVDKEGKVVAVETWGVKLHEKLAELLGDK